MYTRLNPNEIIPEGWLYRQLRIQADGLSGNLDKVWNDIKDSAWIGGGSEGWERVPYWLDGFIPLAYLLRDDDMKKRADKYVDAILDRQQPDGWICPCGIDERKNYDIWAFFLIGKVLALYCEFTNSEKAEQGLYKSMKCLHNLLENEEISLFNWGKFRWFEAFIPLQFLYDKYNEEWIKELGEIIRNQGADYPSFTEKWIHPDYEWQYDTHIVNIGMMFKYEALTSRFFGEEYNDIADKLWHHLEKYNGTAVGTFTGDECLAGKKNNHGFELCSVVELMYSCEILYELTGNSKWAERLEKIAFNALPATISDDMWTHQYDQQVNQIECSVNNCKPYFGTNSNESHFFGLEPNYGCCTANFNQGWPKLAMNVLLKSSKGVSVPVILPFTVNTVINDVEVKIKCETDYPFKLFAKYTVEAASPVNFEFEIRVPKWSEAVNINGDLIKKKSKIIIKKTWTQESFTIEFDDKPKFVSRPFSLKAVEYGSLVFALPITTKYVMHEYEKNGIERKFPYCDYELLPQSDWEYGFKNKLLKLKAFEVSDVPFSSCNPALKITANLSKINWGYEEGYKNIASYKPASRKAMSEPIELELIPYGCSKLRMTEMPEIK